MSNISVGTLHIDLEANTYSFTGQLDKAGQKAKSSADGIAGAFNKMDLGEARGSLMTLNEELGLHLPRHVTGLVSQLPGLASALESAFPIIAIVAVGKALFELNEHLKKQAEALEKAKSGMLDLAVSTRTHAEALEISRLKVEDHIRALEGVTSKNGLVVALREAKKAADELADSIQKDIGKESELLGTLKQGTLAQLYITHRDMSQDMIMGFTEYADKRRRLQQQIDLADTEAAKDKLRHGPDGLDTLDVAWNNRVEFERKKTALELQSRKAAIFNPATGVTNTVDIAKGGTVEKDLQNKADLLSKMALLARSEQERESEAVALATQNKKAAGLEQLHSAVDNLDKQWTETKKVLAATTAETVAVYELQFRQGKINADQLSALKQATLDKQYGSEVAHFEKIKTLYSQHPALLKQIQTAEDAMVSAHNTQVLDTYTKTLDAQRKGLDSLARANFEFYRKEEEQAGKSSAAIVQIIDAKDKKWLADMALIQGAGSRRIEQIDREIAELHRVIDQYHLQGKAAEDMYQKIHNLSQQRQRDVAQELIQSGRIGPVMHGTMMQMARDGAQWQASLAGTFKNTVDGMNQNLASFLTTGKANWAGFAQSAISSIIGMGLQYVESKLLMMMIDKIWGSGKAAANIGMAESNTAVAATEALASVPWPFNIAAAAETEALGQGFVGQASVAFFERGGIVPDDMRAILHRNEMVLPEPIASHVMKTAGGGDSGQTNGKQHITYAPTIQALAASSADIDKVLHGSFERFIRGEMRRRGMRE